MCLLVWAAVGATKESDADGVGNLTSAEVRQPHPPENHGQHRNG